MVANRNRRRAGSLLRVSLVVPGLSGKLINTRESDVRGHMTEQERSVFETGALNTHVISWQTFLLDNTSIPMTLFNPT